MDIIPDNAYVMIIAFSHSASVRHPFVKITSNITRTTLAQKVPSRAGGGTCIGCGINLALDNLEVSILYIYNAYITLFYFNDWVAWLCWSVLG